MSDVLVRCIHCGNEQTVDFGYCLGRGWPKCCNYTMRLITKAKDIEIEKAVSSLFKEKPDIYRGVEEKANV